MWNEHAATTSVTLSQQDIRQADGHIDDLGRIEHPSSACARTRSAVLGSRSLNEPDGVVERGRLGRGVGVRCGGGRIRWNLVGGAAHRKGVVRRVAIRDVGGSKRTHRGSGSCFICQGDGGCARPRFRQCIGRRRHNDGKGLSHEERGLGHLGVAFGQLFRALVRQPPGLMRFSVPQNDASPVEFWVTF